MIVSRVRTFQIPVPVLVLLFLFTSENAFAESPGPQSFTATNAQSSDTGDTQQWRLETIGVQSMVVLTESHNTGFGYGARLTNRFVNDQTQMITEIGFWGATKDTLDIAVFGFQESLTYEMEKTDRIKGFVGICIGYFYIYETIPEIRNGESATAEYKNNSIDVFFTYGMEYTLDDTRAIFIQMKYGSTKISDEFHIIAGLNFDPRKLLKQPDD